MKSLSKKAIVTSIATLLIVPSVAFAGWNYTHQKTDTPKETPEVAYSPLIVQDKPSAPATEPSVNPAPTTPDAVVTPPTILSADEYAAKYLDLSTTFLQECWTMIKDMYPNRFTEQLREKSIQRIAPAYRNICGARKQFCTSSDGTVHMYNTIIGQNGEYFN